MQPIYTQTVGAGGVATVTFNNIPQTFTDLQVVISARTTAAVTATDIFAFFNNDTGGANVYSGTRLYGTGSSVASDRQSNTNVMRWGDAIGTSSTSNTFASTSVYVPNYTTSTFKQVIINSVDENNATAANSFLSAMLYFPSSPTGITKILLGPLSGSFAQHTTVTVYGITKG